MHGCGYAGCLQALLHGNTVWHADGVLSPGAGVVRFDVWEGQGQWLTEVSPTEEVCVGLRHLLAHSNFFFKNRQLGQHNGRLDGVQAAVHAHTHMVITSVLAVSRNFPHHLRQFIVIGKDCTTITIGAQRLAWKEASAGNGRQVATLASLVGGTKALGCVFDDRDAVFGGYGVDGVEVGTLAVHADRHDGFGAWCDGGFQQGGVEVVGSGVDVNVDGFCAQQSNGFGGGNVGKAGCDDFVTGANAQCHLRNLQSVRTVGHSDAIFRPCVFDQLFLKFGHFGSKNVLTVIQDFLDVGINLRFEALILAFKVDKFHGNYLFCFVNWVPLSVYTSPVYWHVVCACP